MKKIRFSKIFTLLATLLSIVSLMFMVSAYVKAENTTYETPDYISVSDLVLNGKSVGNKIVMKAQTAYTYNKTATFGSVVFSFKFKNTTWNQDSDGVQFHLYGTWQMNGAFWLRPDANRIIYKVGDNAKYITGSAIKAGEHDVELGRLAILENNEYTGKQYYYIKMDGTVIAEYTLNDLDSSIMSNNNIFMTGTNGNSIVDTSWTGSTVTYVSNKVVVDSFKTTENYLTKPTNDPVVPGKKFVGWFDSLGSEWDFKNNMVTDDLVLTAGFIDENETTSDEVYFSDENFTPVLRFLVSSDNHIAKTASGRESRLASEFDIAYRYASESTKYNNLDAALFAGDLSDDGSPSALSNWKNVVDENVKGGTQVIVSMGNHEFRTYDSVTHEIVTFEDILNATCDSHTVINGYHFIALSPNLNEGYNFSETKVKWLEEQLAIAQEDNPNIPIFVIQHENIKGTVYGSKSWGMDELTEVIAKYPQVVDFSGHSHYPLADPRSIWQGSFTALSTGTLHYYEMGINGYKDANVFVKDKTGGWSTSVSSAGSTAEFLIVEVDADNAIRVIVYDIENNREITRYYMRNIMDDIKFTYSHVERKKTAEKPYFDNASINASVSEDSLTLEFDQAKCADVVESYRIELYSNNKLVRTEYALSDYFMYEVPEKIKIKVYNLDEETEYVIKVYAVNVWNMESDGFITTTITTGKVTVYEDVIDEISLNDLRLAGGNVVTTDLVNSYKEVHFIPSENNMYGSFKLKMQLLYIGGDFQVTFNKVTTNDDMVWMNNGKNNIWFIKEGYRSPEAITPGLHIVEYGRYHLTEGTKSYTVFYIKIDETFYHEYKSTNIFTNDGYFSLNFGSAYRAGSRYYDIDEVIEKNPDPKFSAGENIVLSSPITNWAYLGGLITFDSLSPQLTCHLEDASGRITSDMTVSGAYTLGKTKDYYHYSIKTKSFDLISGMTGYEQVTKFMFSESDFKIANIDITYYTEEKFDNYDEISIFDIGLPTTNGIYSNSEMEFGYSYYGTSESFSGILRYYLVCGNLDQGSEFRSQLGTLWSYACSLWIQAGNPNYGFFGFNYSTRSSDKANINLKSNNVYLIETAVLLVTEGEWAGWKYTYFKVDDELMMGFYAPINECVATSYAVAFKIKGNYEVADISLKRDIEYIVDSEVYTKVTAISGCNIYEPTMPTKEGYYFTGWYTSPTGGERVNFTDKFESDEKTVRYYARFSDKLGLVKFYQEGKLIESQEVGIGGFVLKPTTPIKTGEYKYSFVNWVIKGTNNVYDFTTEVTEDLELEAIFEEYRYKIVYRVDGKEYTTKYYVESEPTTIIGNEPEVPTYIGSTGYWDYSVDTRTKGDIYAIARYIGKVVSETDDIKLNNYNGNKVDIADDLTRYYLSFSTSQDQKEWLITYPVSGGHEKQNITFSWTDSSKNSYYVVYFADNSDFNNAFVVRTSKTSLSDVGIFIPGKTYYWKVVGENTNKASKVDTFTVINTPVRWISAGTIYNMRDLGGWTTIDNKEVKYGMIYRGGQLKLDQSGEASYMNDYSSKVFDYLGMKTEIELRGETTHTLNQFNELEKMLYVNGQGYNTMFTMSDTIKGYYIEAFKLLADESNYPIYFHCSWGADRTGSLAFLINGILGVPYEQLVEDFELTSLSYSGRRERESTGFDAMYNTILTTYGDETGNFQVAMNNYLVNYIGVKQSIIDQIRSLLLTDATEQVKSYTITYRINGKEYLKSNVLEGGHASNVAPVYFVKHFSHWLLNGEVFDINTPITSDVTLDAVYETTYYETYDTVTVRDLGLGEEWTPTETSPIQYLASSTSGGRIFEFDYEIVSATGAFNDGVHLEMASFMWTFKAHLWIADYQSQHVFTGGDGNPTVTSRKVLTYGETYNIKFGVVIPLNGPYAGEKMLIFMIDDEIICEIPTSSDISGKSIGLSGTQGILHSVENKKTVTYMGPDGISVIERKVQSRGTLLEAINSPVDDGKVFIGWYDSLGNKWNLEKDKLLNDITLFARFGDATIKALVLDNEGYEIIDDYQVKIGAKVSELEVPKAKKGLEFDGWYNGETKLSDNDIIAENMNLICRFKAIEEVVDPIIDPIEKGCKGTISLGYGLIALTLLAGSLFIKRKKED